jgi:hypothetical protein
MPKLGKTIVPRIRKSLHSRGLAATCWRCLLGPYTLIRHYVKNRKSYVNYAVRDEFDQQHGIETSQRVHLTDLKIDSPNWIYADGYWPTPPEVFHEALSSLNRKFEGLTFIDFGSGKGRVLLMASEYPFRKIIGVEFAGELHSVALQNISRYKSSTQQCRDIASICADFTQFPIPAVPLFIFLYNPSSREITAGLAKNIARSLQEHPRELWVLYVTPAYDVFESGDPLALRKIKTAPQYAIYTNLPATPETASELAPTKV